LAPRIIAALAALSLTGLTFLILHTTFGENAEDAWAWAFDLSIATVAALCWWFALRGHIAGDQLIMRFALIGGLILGALGFAAGFLGPLLFTPGANQGPLLGIFFTGPLGFAAGAWAGALVGFIRRRTTD
jgi:hypothetical protein